MPANSVPQILVATEAFGLLQYRSHSSTINQRDVTNVPLSPFWARLLAADHEKAHQSPLVEKEEQLRVCITYGVVIPPQRCSTRPHSGRMALGKNASRARYAHEGLQGLAPFGFGGSPHDDPSNRLNASNDVAICLVLHRPRSKVVHIRGQELIRVRLLAEEKSGASIAGYDD